MNSDFEQAQLTAYALDELDGVERDEIQARIAADPEALKFVQQVQQTAGLLRQELQNEPASPGLATEQHQTIDQALSGLTQTDPIRNKPSIFWRRSVWTGLGVAACLVVAVLLPRLGAARRGSSQFAQSIPGEDDALPTGRVASSPLALVDQMNQPAGALPSTRKHRSAAGQATEDAKASTPPSAYRPDAQVVGRERNRLEAPKEVVVTPLARLAAKDDGGDTDAFNGGSISPTARTKRKQRAQLDPVVTMSGQILALHGKEQKMDADVLRSVVAGSPAPDARRQEESELPGRYNPNFDTEAYDRVVDNPFLRVTEEPLSTFSIDVDTASYANIRRFITQQRRFPPKDAVRIEEMINYFPYDFPYDDAAVTSDGHDAQHEDQPFAVHVEVAAAPWAPHHRLAKIGLKADQITQEERPPANLVFLLDVSGSMARPNKLPLLKQAMGMLVGELTENDRVSIVVYAGASGLVLEATPASQKQTILSALTRLRSGGSTNGGAGIELAYKMATEHFIKGGINRVILATDGDFNVGLTDRGALTRLIEKKAKTGVYLTLLGFGMGNVKDAMMEQLSNKGNGNYAYIDSMQEARKVLVEQVGGTMMTVAKDVKVQIEFNPAQVQAYRLIGYENRVLAKQDFNDDTKDAGDIGAGHNVTALYELVPAGQPVPSAVPSAAVQAQIQDLEKQIQQIRALLANGKLSDQGVTQLEVEITRLDAQITSLRQQTPAVPAVDQLKYQQPVQRAEGAGSGDLFTLKIRYKAPDAPKQQGTSKLIAVPVQDGDKSLEQASPDFHFATAVASFGMILRDSPYQGTSNYQRVLDLAASGITGSNDPNGYRREFVALVGQAKVIANR